MSAPADVGAGRRLPNALLALAGVVLVATIVAAPVDTSDAGAALTAAMRGVSSEPWTLFVHGQGDVWYPPLAVYPSLLLARLGVGEEAAARLPSLIAGLATLALTAALAGRVLGSASIGAAAAWVLLAMPGFREQAATPGAALLLPALVLAWLGAVLAYVARRQQWRLLVGGAALGLCAYAHPAGVLTIPVFAAIGVRALWPVRQRSTDVVAAGVVIALLLLPAAIWVARHLEAYPDTFGRWAIHGAHLRNPWDGVVAFSRWHVLARRIGDYWQYFNPTFLFGGRMFGLALVLLLPFGLWRLATRASSRAAAVVAAGFVAGAIPAALLDVPRSPALVTTLLPFAAVIAAIPLRTWWGLRELTHPEK